MGTQDGSHSYRVCRDKDCPRYACQAYREGREDGFEEGHGAGYSAGYAAGQAAAGGEGA